VRMAPSKALSKRSFRNERTLNPFPLSEGQRSGPTPRHPPFSLPRFE
jgi:hypothetical protein